jgi:hypothetical protein
MPVKLQCTPKSGAHQSNPIHLFNHANPYPLARCRSLGDPETPIRFLLVGLKL